MDFHYVHRGSSTRRFLYLIFCILLFATLATIATLGITTTTFVRIENGYKQSRDHETNISAMDLVSSVQVDQAIQHLRRFQIIADVSNGTRVVSSIGFNRTHQYIIDYLTSNTNLVVKQIPFFVRNFRLEKNPQLISYIDDIQTNYAFANDLRDGDFVHATYSGSINLDRNYSMIHISNDGCSLNDWQSYISSLQGHVVLLKLSTNCDYIQQVAIAVNFNISALLLYNDQTTLEGFFPNEVVVLQNNSLPILILTYKIGRSFADALALNPNSVQIELSIDLIDLPPLPVTNICADTKTGDATKTIMAGSHSDSVPFGPGINDNGSGSAVNLVLATTVSRLLQTSLFEKFSYRIRFCWWGAEEIDMLGSDYFVEQAKVVTTVGERLSDILAYLNFDMLGSPNFLLATFNPDTIKNQSSRAVIGSRRITNLFREFFERENLPWNLTRFSGYSDYAAFLAAGIAAGGLFSGSSAIKSREQRDFYASFQSHHISGIVGAAYDPCYHRLCDSLGNISEFSLEKLLKAAAYVLEKLARENDLSSWLYPTKFQ